MHPHLAARRLDVLHTQLENQRSVLLSWLDTLERQLHQFRQTLGSEEYLRILSLIDRMRDETAALGAGDQISVLALQKLGEQLCHTTQVREKTNSPQEESAALSKS
jgi:hypothetical protein